MTLVRRTLAVVSLALCWLPALAAPAHAQAPGLPGYLPPGEYKGSNSFADFHTVINGTMNVDVGINDFSSTNMPKPGFTFPPSGEQAILTVSAFDFSNFTSFSGCYLISPGDFMAASDLSNMTLITKIEDNTPPCSPFLTNNIPAGTTISFQWLGTGPIAANQDSSHFSCTAYTQENQARFSNNLATVSGTIPGVLPGPISDVAGFMAQGQSDLHVSGVPDQTCPPGGNGAKGAGPGPQLPGNYEFSNHQAFAVFQSADSPSSSRSSPRPRWTPPTRRAAEAPLRVRAQPPRLSCRVHARRPRPALAPTAAPSCRAPLPSRFGSRTSTPSRSRTGATSSRPAPSRPTASPLPP